MHHVLTTIVAIVSFLIMLLHSILKAYRPVAQIPSYKLISKPRFHACTKSACVTSAGPYVWRRVVYYCSAKLSVAASLSYSRHGSDFIGGLPMDRTILNKKDARAPGEWLAYPNALCIRISQSHNSSSSSMFDSVVVVGMVPSEFPRSFCDPKSAAPRLLRTFSSKPGREARCFLNGDAMLLSASAPPVVEEEEASAPELPGTGVPETGDPDDEFPSGGPRPRGSAECCRFSLYHVS